VSTLSLLGGLLDRIKPRPESVWRESVQKCWPDKGYRAGPFEER
jgi:hypothetical protein